MIEIERKFLVTSNSYQQEAHSKIRISQGFLNTHPERTVRIRIKGERGYITVKGKSNAAGTSRYEWEKEIPVTEASQLLSLCEKDIIEKDRFEIKIDAFTFEVDEFYGANKGLIIAEIELSDEKENFPIPGWLGKEVTGDIAYYNSQLSKYPFKNWH